MNHFSFGFVFLFCLAFIPGCKKDDDPCAEENKLTFSLSADDKKWLDCSVKSELILEDSLGNIKVFQKTSFNISYVSYCNIYMETGHVTFSNDTCPFLFKIAIGKYEAGFGAGFYVGLQNAVYDTCFSYFDFKDYNFLPTHDSITIRSKTFYDIYELIDSSRTFYFTRSDGVVAFTSDAILWVQNQ